MGHKSYPKVEIAFKIAARYPDRIPRAAELMEQFGFGETIAYGFIGAMRKSRPELQQVSLQEAKERFL